MGLPLLDKNKAELHSFLYIRRTTWQFIIKAHLCQEPVEQETFKWEHRTEFHAGP